MTSTKKERDEAIQDEKDAEKAYQKDRATTVAGEIQPGCSAPDQVSPSVVGTAHDPRRKTPKTEES